MAISAKRRHDMFSRLEEVMGTSQATTLMEHLPPEGWADVATKRDLEVLESRIESRIERLESRFEALEFRIEAFESRIEGRLFQQEAAFLRAMQAQTWRLVTVMVATVVALGSFMLAAVRL